MGCGGGLTEENYQCGVVCALRIRKVTSLENKAYLYLAEAMEWIRSSADFN